MAQIKLSIAFVLAAAAIAPVVAQPFVGEGHEFAGDLGHRHHHHRHPIPDSEQLSHHDNLKVLVQDGRTLDHRPVVHSEPEIVAREYAEFDGMFERADSEDVESGAKTLPRFTGKGLIGKPIGLGHWHGLPVAPRRPHRGPYTLHRPYFGLGPVVPYRPRIGTFAPNRPGGLRRLRFGHGPVVIRHPRILPLTHQRPNFGPGPEVPHHASGPAGLGIVAREYAESDNMFERDFDEVEFDARDFDELYLD